MESDPCEECQRECDPWEECEREKAGRALRTIADLYSFFSSLIFEAFSLGYLGKVLI
jgi:hypothetical protein